jgi:hypothetical protein
MRNCNAARAICVCDPQCVPHGATIPTRRQRRCCPRLRRRASRSEDVDQDRLKARQKTQAHRSITTNAACGSMIYPRCFSAPAIFFAVRPR